MEKIAGKAQHYVTLHLNYLPKSWIGASWILPTFGRRFLEAACILTAIDRLNEYSPNWPLPKIFRIKKSGTIDQSIFSGSTINTPSLLCVADYVAALEWAREVGGLNKLIEIADNNLQIIKNWVAETDWIKFLAKEESTISNTSVDFLKAQMVMKSILQN